MCQVTMEQPLNTVKALKKRPSSPVLRTLIYKKQWDEVESVLKRSPSQAESADRMGDLPLHEACLQGAPFSVVKNLLAAYPDGIKQKGFCGRLALHYAAYVKPSLHLIRLLLQRYPEGATIFDADGRLPLHLAVVRNAPKQVIETLICAYPKGLKTPNRFGSTPLMLARNNQMAGLLKKEEKQPRNVKKKIALEKNMLSVWDCPRKSPVSMNDKERDVDLLGLGIHYPKTQKKQSQTINKRKKLKPEVKHTPSRIGGNRQSSKESPRHSDKIRKPLQTKRTLIPSPSASLVDGYNSMSNNARPGHTMKVPAKIVLNSLPVPCGINARKSKTMSSGTSTFSIDSPRGPLDLKAHHTMQKTLLALEQSWG